eukprot:9864922-Lingulodinium_polyedra.AAC.1
MQAALLRSLPEALRWISQASLLWAARSPPPPACPPCPATVAPACPACPACPAWPAWSGTAAASHQPAAA